MHSQGCSSVLHLWLASTTCSGAALMWCIVSQVRHRPSHNSLPSPCSSPTGVLCTLPCRQKLGAQVVAELHVQTVGDLLAFPAAALTAKFGAAAGAFLAALPHAVDDTPVSLPLVGIHSMPGSMFAIMRSSAQPSLILHSNAQPDSKLEIRDCEKRSR